MERLLIQNIGLLATPAGHEARRGPAQGEISMTKNAWLLAEDGVIDDTERPEFDDIVEDLRETIAAAYQVIYADGAKKERPEAGTSKRSRSQRNSENHCKHSISQKKTNVNTFRGEARA